jgi:hypothetical protein
VDKAELGVTADSMSRTYGLTNPPLTVSYTGFVNNDGTNVLAGTPSIITIATNNSPPGNYAITPGVGTLSSTNYTFVFVNGTLTVVAPPQLSVVPLSLSQLVVSWPTITNQTYQLESATNLIAATWTPVGDLVAGTGVPITVTNTIDASPQQFFRLTISP